MTGLDKNAGLSDRVQAALNEVALAARARYKQSEAIVGLESAPGWRCPARVETVAPSPVPRAKGLEDGVAALASQVLNLADELAQSDRYILSCLQFFSEDEEQRAQLGREAEAAKVEAAEAAKQVRRAVLAGEEEQRRAEEYILTVREVSFLAGSAAAAAAPPPLPPTPPELFPGRFC